MTPRPATAPGASTRSRDRTIPTNLHRLRTALDAMLAREGRTALAQACFDFLPTRSLLDLEGWPDTDIFAHA